MLDNAQRCSGFQEKIFLHYENLENIIASRRFKSCENIYIIVRYSN
jgi:hypothetical protein